MSQLARSGLPDSEMIPNWRRQIDKLPLQPPQAAAAARAAAELAEIQRDLLVHTIGLLQWISFSVGMTALFQAIMLYQAIRYRSSNST